jgi:hypothetical protein
MIRILPLHHRTPYSFRELTILFELIHILPRLITNPPPLHKTTVENSGGMALGEKYRLTNEGPFKFFFLGRYLILSGKGYHNVEKVSLVAYILYYVLTSMYYLLLLP